MKIPIKFDRIPGGRGFASQQYLLLYADVEPKKPLYRYVADAIERYKIQIIGKENKMVKLKRKHSSEIFPLRGREAGSHGMEKSEIR
ncbi:hypothetical protein JT06_03310 [Desulfobulbus sp. Tol-SR]|jgi:hypothetical protein|nr:hypothetical protein JT06_03310 [Desulfobulbus sp. Tol-SR]